jgi:hypothetical protein
MAREGFDPEGYINKSVRNRKATRMNEECPKCKSKSRWYRKLVQLPHDELCPNEQWYSCDDVWHSEVQAFSTYQWITGRDVVLKAFEKQVKDFLKGSTTGIVVITLSRPEDINK